MSNAPYPNYEDTVRESREMAASAPGTGHLHGDRQVRGRPAAPPADDHGPEHSRRAQERLPAERRNGWQRGSGTCRGPGRGPRAAGAATLRTHLQRQVVLVVPVTNPDGCERDQADRLGNARGVPATEVHLQDRPPATAEGRAMRALVEEWIPDAHVDFHGLAGGSMGDCSFLYPTVNAKWSIPILMEVEKEMEEAGARAGFPQQGRPRLWWEPRTNLPGWLARNYSSLCMVVEGTENYYPIEDSVRAGVVRMLRFMEIGEEVRFFQDFPNYPCDLVSGGRMGALMSYGTNYTERRKSRRDISQMILQGVPWFERLPCDHDWTAVLGLAGAGYGQDVSARHAIQGDHRSAGHHQAGPVAGPCPGTGSCGPSR